MKQTGSLLWIFVLLTALIAGPVFIRGGPDGPPEPPPLRVSIEAERLLDAVANLPQPPRPTLLRPIGR
ncbi:MAG: hypothetical protein ABII00_07300 [Elusimicrobiota bacterium]